MSEAKSKTPRAPRLNLDVTADIIRDSKGRDPSNCMMAQAVRAAYPDAQKVGADIHSIRFSDPRKNLRFCYITPRKVAEAIITFDQGILPEAFQVRLTGGQVTLSGRRPDVREASEAQKAQRLAASAASAAAREKLKKARLVPRNEGSKGPDGIPYGGAIPEIVGGKPPPLSIPRRREFGIKAYDRIR